MKLSERVFKKLARIFTRLFSVLLKTGGIRSRYGWIPACRIRYRLLTSGRRKPTARPYLPTEGGRDPPQVIPHSFISLPALLCVGSLQW